MSEVCERCMFATQDGECRRHAPIVTGGLHTSIETVWPKVDGDDWCGDFEGISIKPQNPAERNKQS